MHSLLEPPLRDSQLSTCSSMQTYDLHLYVTLTCDSLVRQAHCVGHIDSRTGHYQLVSQAICTHHVVQNKLLQEDRRYHLKGKVAKLICISMSHVCLELACSHFHWQALAWRLWPQDNKWHTEYSMYRELIVYFWCTECPEVLFSQLYSKCTRLLSNFSFDQYRVL